MLVRREMAIGGAAVVVTGAGGRAEDWELAVGSAEVVAAGLLAMSLARPVEGALGADLNANFFLGAKVERVS